MSEWILDFHTPGGVDRDGWQYATDFPSQYHGKKHFTDYVRRRRWFRRCQLTTSGPWKELGNTKLVDVSLHVCKIESLNKNLILLFNLCCLMKICNLLMIHVYRPLMIQIQIPLFMYGLWLQMVKHCSGEVFQNFVLR